ncbi:MAG: PrsW family glutamic-type intramembrane protease [Pseudomonadales bacterium]|nr:PrsW family glutamic-type intramembrane protease [Pseudomonadales bacterium]
MTYLLFLFAVTPPLFLAYLIYKLDRYEKEPVGVCLRVFFYGCLTVIPVIIIEPIVIAFINSLFFQIFLGVALVEEYFKFLVVKNYAYKRESFNEPFDGIVYAVIASLGFALVENIGYVFGSAEEEQLFTAIARMFTAIPLHALAGVLMGYFLGKAKFDKSNEKTLIVKGLLSAIILHTAYDYFLLQDNSNLVIFSFVSLVVAFYIAKKSIKKSRSRSPFKPNDIH